MMRDAPEQLIVEAAIQLAPLELRGVAQTCRQLLLDLVLLPELRYRAIAGLRRAQRGNHRVVVSAGVHGVPCKSRQAGRFHRIRLQAPCREPTPAMASCREAADAGGTLTTMKDSFSSPTSCWTGPLFIVGMPRSGTKLPARSARPASAHPHPVHRDGFPAVSAALGARAWAASSSRRRSRPCFRSCAALLFHVASRRGGDVRRAANGASTAPVVHDAAGLFEGFVRYETGSGVHTNYIWGDKSPSYTRHVATLLEQFPQARVVHICATSATTASRSTRHGTRTCGARLMGGARCRAAHRVCRIRSRSAASRSRMKTCCGHRKR